MFDIPIVLFIFKRPEKSVRIINQIAQIQPHKLYIISDAGRTAQEREEVAQCRSVVEKSITWDCEVVKNYADENKGCFDRIGLGALWVLEREKWAIFLEDDNFPEISFFPYCRELLERYEHDDRVLWVCGTNYLEEYQPEAGSDYVFTHHMLPCGWASWSHKFRKYYDAEFQNLNLRSLKRIKKQYTNKKLYSKDRRNWKMEIANKRRTGRFCSWDYQMCFSIRYHNKFGIAPKYNQIRNIGVDSASEHGGSSFDSVMTQRFCGMGSRELEFPMKHPEKVMIDEGFETLTDAIVIPPFDLGAAVRGSISRGIRRLMRIPAKQSLRDYFRQHKKEGRNEKK